MSDKHNFNNPSQGSYQKQNDKKYVQIHINQTEKASEKQRHYNNNLEDRQKIIKQIKYLEQIIRSIFNYQFVQQIGRVETCKKQNNLQKDIEQLTKKKKIFLTMLCSIGGQQTIQNIQRHILNNNNKPQEIIKIIKSKCINYNENNSIIQDKMKQIKHHLEQKIIKNFNPRIKINQEGLFQYQKIYKLIDVIQQSFLTIINNLQSQNKKKLAELQQITNIIYFLSQALNKFQSNCEKFFSLNDKFIQNKPSDQTFWPKKDLKNIFQSISKDKLTIKQLMQPNVQQKNTRIQTFSQNQRQKLQIQKIIKQNVNFLNDNKLWKKYDNCKVQEKLKIIFQALRGKIIKLEKFQKISQEVDFEKRNPNIKQNQAQLLYKIKQFAQQKNILQKKIQFYQKSNQSLKNRLKKSQGQVSESILCEQQKQKMLLPYLKQKAQKQLQLNDHQKIKTQLKQQNEQRKVRLTQQQKYIKSIELQKQNFGQNKRLLRKFTLSEDYSQYIEGTKKLSKDVLEKQLEEIKKQYQLTQMKYQQLKRKIEQYQSKSNQINEPKTANILKMQAIQKQDQKQIKQQKTKKHLPLKYSLTGEISTYTRLVLQVLNQSIQEKIQIISNQDKKISYLQHSVRIYAQQIEQLNDYISAIQTQKKQPCSNAIITNPTFMKESHILRQKTEQKLFLQQIIANFLKIQNFQIKPHYFYQKMNTDFSRYLNETQTFVIIFQHKSNGFITGAFKTGLNPNSTCFIFNLTCKKVFYPQERAKSVLQFQKGRAEMSFGNRQLTIKTYFYKEIMTMECKFSMFGLTHFDIENTEQFSGSKEENQNQIIVDELEIFKIQAK